MGRVEDAMRRAAEAEAAPASQSGTAASGAALADAFPEEGEAAPPVAELELRTLEPAEPAGPEPAQPEGGPLFKRIDAAMAEKIVIDHQTLPASREQYRKLAATLHQAQATNGLKVVMIASAVSGEGKTLTAANLALTLSESYQRDVLLIDGDLRRPSQHLIFKLPPSPGLSEGLLATNEPRLPLHQVSPHLTILTAGRPTDDPMAGLSSGRMQRLIEEARGVFEWVIVDTPPVGLLTDANLLSSMVDAALLVIKAGSTPYELVLRAVEAIGRERLLGTVLNQAAATAVHTDYSYYYDSSSSRQLR